MLTLMFTHRAIEFSRPNIRKARAVELQIVRPDVKRRQYGDNESGTCKAMRLNWLYIIQTQHKMKASDKEYLYDTLDYVLRADVAYHIYRPQFPDLAVNMFGKTESRESSSMLSSILCGVGEDRKRFWNNLKAAQDLCGRFDGTQSFTISVTCTRKQAGVGFQFKGENMYTVTRQCQWPDGDNVVEVSVGGIDYCNPDALSPKYAGEFEEYKIRARQSK